MGSLSRKEMILAAINTSKGAGLELGPLYSPILTKQEADIYYLDHVSLEELKKKYAKEPVPLEKIVAIDYVLKENSIQHTVGTKKFNYVIASHVIEHVPDMVRWLQDIATVLKPGGILSLVIPDKRFTFDIARNVSTPADVMGAYVESRVKPTARDMYDFAVEYRKNIDPLKIWNDPLKDHTRAQKRYSPDEALEMCKQNLDPSIYVDCHCYVLTPHAFFNILCELIHHNLLDFELADYFEPNPGNLEFYISLRHINKKKISKSVLLATLPKNNQHLDFETLSNRLQNEQAENVTLRQQNVALQQGTEALTSSTSWKITQPLRTLSRLLGSRK